MENDEIVLIFDCDGVLIDSELIGASIELEQLQQIGCQIDLEQYLLVALGRTEEEVVWTEIAEKNGVALPLGFVEETRMKVSEAFEKELRPIEGIEQVLEELPYRKCVASGSLPARIRRTLGLSGLLHYFDGNLFSGAEVPKGKPHPDLFLYAARKMKSRPENCIVIEDSHLGTRGAKKAGMKVIGFTGGSHFQPALFEELQRSGVDSLISRMKDLPGQCEKLKKEILQDLKTDD